MENNEGPDLEFLTMPGLLRVLNKKEKVVSREFVYRMAKRGLIPTYRIGGKIFCRLPEVLASMRQVGEK